MKKDKCVPKAGMVGWFTPTKKWQNQSGIPENEIRPAYPAIIQGVWDVEKEGYGMPCVDLLVPISATMYVTIKLRKWGDKKWQKGWDFPVKPVPRG
jgi:hypothetical protein